MKRPNRPKREKVTECFRTLNKLYKIVSDYQYDEPCVSQIYNVFLATKQWFESSDDAKKYLPAYDIDLKIIINDEDSYFYDLEVVYYKESKESFYQRMSQYTKDLEKYNKYTCSEEYIADKARRQEIKDQKIFEKQKLILQEEIKRREKEIIELLKKESQLNELKQ